MQKIHSRDELIKREKRLEKLFLKLTEAMIAARKAESRAHTRQPELSREEEVNSDLLRSELNRIYRLPGGRELIERAEQSSLDKLDRFERLCK